MTENEWLVSTNPESMLECLINMSVVAFPTEVQEYVSKIRINGLDHKFRLFACACARQVWHLLTDNVPCPTCGNLDRELFMSEFGRGPLCVDCGGIGQNGKALPGTGRINRSRKAIEIAEKYADDKATLNDMNYAYAQTSLVSRRSLEHHANLLVRLALAYSVDIKQVISQAIICGILPITQADLIRDVVGNPFRFIDFDPAWRTPTVLSLTRAAYNEFAPHGCLDGDRLAVLADALEDAGCNQTYILEHLHGREPNIKWKTDHDNNYSGFVNYGWKPLRSQHIRGCWVLDIILGKQ